MATNVVKSIKCETFEGTFNGMITINLASEVDGNIVTNDGVFTIGKTNKIRINVKYLMAVLRNGKHSAAINCWLDSLKSQPLAIRQAAWALALNGQEIDIEAELQEADEEHSNQWYSHNIENVVLSNAVINAAYMSMARVLVPGISIIEAKDMAVELRNAAEE